jgi:hypothetical protein
MAQTGRTPSRLERRKAHTREICEWPLPALDGPPPARPRLSERSASAVG